MKVFTKFYGRVLTFLLFVCAHSGVFGQSTANYAFSTNTNGSLALDMNGNAIDMSSGTTALSNLVANTDNGVVSSAVNIGFDFFFYGSRYTQFSANSNGLIGLGSTLISSSGYVTSSGTTTTPRLSAFCADLQLPLDYQRSVLTLASVLRAKCITS